MTTQEQKDQEFADALAQASEAASEMVTALLKMATVAAMLVDVTKKLREIEPMLGRTFPTPVYHVPDVVFYDEKGKLIHLNKEPE
jgi:hypothetical protein